MAGPKQEGQPALQTQLVHHAYRPPAEFESPAVPVHKGSTVYFPNVAAMRSRDWKDKSAYTYGLHGTPTSFTLEERMATVEGGQFCLLAPSGLSAITVVDMALLATGDELLIPDNAYGPGKAFAEGELRQWGITPRYYNAMDPADLARSITPATRLVWLEAPGSVTLEYPDIPALVAVVQAANRLRPREARPIVTALDNTWGAGVAFSPFSLGVDISMQAITKYPSGGGDVLMGSVVTQNASLHRQLLLCHMRLGLGVGANDIELVLRGLPSMVLRYHAQDQATRELAQWMQQQPAVAQVFHPALAGSPGHEHWKRTAQAAACLFSVVFQPQFSDAQVDAVCDRLQRFKLGYSWAGPVSLVVPYDIASMRQQPWPYANRLLRFAVGLEAVEDLKADLLQAMAHLG